MSAVEAYVEEVRVLLTGLDAEEVGELTDSLAADLSDAVRDTDDGQPLDRESLVRRFGPPREYAEELCAAAGLTLGGAAPKPRRRLRSRLAALRGWWAAHRPSWLGELAPVWWVLRGWILFQMAVRFVSIGRQAGAQNLGVIPYAGALKLVLAVTIAGSIVLGIARRRAADQRPMRWASGLVTAGAVLLALPMMAAANTADSDLVWSAYADRGNGYGTQVVYQGGDGVWVDGMQVSNLFAYDADGEPLTGVQLYDDRGRPVETISSTDSGLWPYSLALPGVSEPWTFYPSEDADGRTRWNVYPLQGVPDSALDYDQGYDMFDQIPLKAGEELRQPPIPFAKAPAVGLLVQDQTPSSTGGEQPTGTLSAESNATS